jgi:mono/diheme cytochrome c family protein
MSDLTRKRRDPGTTWALVTLAVLYFIWYQGMSHSKLPLKASPPAWEVSALAQANLQAKAKIFKGDFKYERRPYAMSEAAQAGMKVFEEHCLGCHGPQGAGNGPSANWMMPKPRNFQSGVFKFITSKSGTLPDREDLLKTITYGLPGSSMPDFRFVPPSDRDNLVEYVLFIARNARRNNLLSRLVAQRVDEIWSDYGEEKPEAISDDDKFSQATLDEIIAENAELLHVKDALRLFPESSEPEIDMDGLVIGAQKFAGYCASCHGPEGRGGLMLKSGSITPL